MHHIDEAYCYICRMFCGMCIVHTYHTDTDCAKTAEPIKMPVGVRLVCPMNHVHHV